MRSLHLLSVLALAGCVVDADAKGSVGTKVELASVTLADECGPPPPASPPVTPARPQKPGEAPRSVTPGYRGNCDQTSMQLTVVTPSGNPGSVFKIKKVELLDDKGKVLQVLTWRSPRAWAANKYDSWDEKLVPGHSHKAMYDLETPDWNKLTNGRWNAHTKAFQVRVTVAVGTVNHTVEKQSITPVRIAPAVPT